MTTIVEDVAAIGRISSVPAILRVVSQMTGLRFVTIARVTGDSWTACAVLDQVDFGLKAGDPLDVATTLCSEVRDSRVPIVIDQASTDPQYCGHRTPRMYGFESYIAVPIFRVDGEYFGNVCALDPLPAKLSDPKIVDSVRLFAELIAAQLEAEERHHRSEAALLDERQTADLREQFIAVLGHDLRNPVSSIGFATEALQRKPLDEQGVTLVERIRRSSDRIARLVDDVLDFARGRLGGGIPVDLQEVPDLDRDLLHVVAELQAAHPERRVECEVALDGTVFCDRIRIAQLLSNLLANALTHGAPGSPVVVTVRGDAAGLTLVVANQGRAIPPDTRANLFEPYRRPQGANPQAGGLGLGLYIAAQIARSHGGTIGVSSDDEVGTTFTVQLPGRGAGSTATLGPC